MSNQSYFPFLSDFLACRNIPFNSYMEIGVCEGNCVSSLITEFPNIGKMVLCDTWGDTYGGSNKGNHDHIVRILEDKKYPIERVTFLDGDSAFKIPEYFVLNPEILDVIFVDGDHSYLGCLIDITNCIKHCNSLLVHDVRHPAYSYIREICYSFYDTIRNDFIMIDNGEYIIYFIRKSLFLRGSNG